MPNSQTALAKDASFLSEDISLSTSNSWTATRSDWGADRGHHFFTTNLGGASVRIETTSRTLPFWLIEVVSRLNLIAMLPQDWNSYGAPRVNQRTLEHSLEVINKLMREMLPTPRVNATAAGGVEFSWCVGGKELEIEVGRPFRVHAYYYDEARADDEWEDEDIGIELERVDPYLEHLAS